MSKKLIVLLFLIAVAILSLALRDAFHRIPAPLPRPLKPPSLSQVMTVSTDTEAKVVLRHPLIPGGANSVADLQRKINADPRLAAFYSQIGFDASCVRMDTLKENAWARVSYRDGDAISFSKHPVLLLTHEKVFVDCNGQMLRARCANAILAPEKQSPAPPAEESFSGLIPSMDVPLDFESPIPAPILPATTTPVPAIPVPGILPTESYPVGACCIVGGGGPRVSADETQS